eukprot:TRINITY_DN100392_c0_g1_i1.p2 TRINITY_DN100392_c0_g1~~TRINITY_DN100392_c0_g1_i1.p2  ORF type:complete len:190 (-),score=44.96 TRINITY_DN100392_c0_g1_i1:80-628(-)
MNISLISSSSGPEDVAKVEAIYAEALERSQADRRFAEEAQCELEERLDKTRKAFEEERRHWAEERKALQQSVAALEEERRAWLEEKRILQHSLQAAIDAAHKRLPPTAAPDVARLLDSCPRGEGLSPDKRPGDISLSSPSEMNPMSPGSGISEASSVARVVCAEDTGSEMGSRSSYHISGEG